MNVFSRILYLRLYLNWPQIWIYPCKPGLSFYPNKSTTICLHSHLQLPCIKTKAESEQQTISTLTKNITESLHLYLNENINLLRENSPCRWQHIQRNIQEIYSIIHISFNKLNQKNQIKITPCLLCEVL